jgi:putative MATE family efflux protein
MVVLFTSVGILTIEPVFKLLGATDSTMPLIKEYMTVWYLGQIFLVIPMMSNDIIRGIGDFIRPSILMIFACVLNIILDPIMIFGYFGCPAMGITGAALATVISRAVTTIFVVYVLVAKNKMISLKALNIKAIVSSWKKIFTIAVPITLGTILMPISMGIITRMVASFGVDAVAAVSAGSRIEMFAFMIPMALGMSLIPFIGQNFGAGRMDRVHEGKKISYIFAIVLGIIIAIIFALSSSWFAELFTKSESVAKILKQYLLIIPIGYGMMEVHRYAGFFMTGINRPVHASICNVIRIVILVALSILGTLTGSIIWLFAARVISDILAGGIGIIYSNIILNRTESTIMTKHRTA